MKPWMKVALGCFAVSVIALFLLVAGLIGFGYWAKNKVAEVASGGAEAQDARRAANSVPFTRPEGDRIAEPRLVKFVEVRADIFSIYEKYRGEIESRVTKFKDGKSPDLGDISTGLTLMVELQKAEGLALAKHGMSEDEYAFITGELYRSMWADLNSGEAGQKAIKDAASAAKTVAEAMKSAGAEGMPPAAREALARAGEEIASGVEQASKGLPNLAGPPENAALFRKYEADLKKYAMPALRALTEGTDGSAGGAADGRR